MARTSRVFISHVADDRPFASDLKRALHDRGIDAWSYEDVARPEESFDEGLRRALQQSIVYVAVLSDDALDSKWIPFEIGAAFGTGKSVFVIDRTSGSGGLPAAFRSFRTIRTKGRHADRAAEQIAGAMTA